MYDEEDSRVLLVGRLAIQCVPYTFGEVLEQHHISIERVVPRSHSPWKSAEGEKKIRRRLCRLAGLHDASLPAVVASQPTKAHATMSI